MKIYFFDFWFILFIKIFRRSQKPEIRQNLIAIDAVENIAIGLSMYSGALVITGIEDIISYYFYPSLSGDFSLTIKMLAVLILWILIYLRFIRKYKWQVIEEMIDNLYTNRKRDLIFIFQTFIFLLYYSLYLVIFFSTIPRN